MLRVSIAGASGYIGKHLVETLSQSHLIKSLSRHTSPTVHPNVSQVSVDLFSHASTAEALKDTDIAIYLVHSMLPSTRLFQGSFHDTDLMLADNFASACLENNVRQIIYVSGIVPQGHISQHLESRKEVEEVLLSTGIPCTILRTGLVVGNGGSSFEILKNLSLNLPLMVLPKWTQSHTQIIYLSDLIKIISTSINNETFFNKTLNITNGEDLRYKDLIKQTTRHIGRNTLFIPVPIHYTSFSKLWVTLFGQSQYQLVSPLVDSLLCDFSNILPDPLIRDLIEYPSFRSMLKKIETRKREKERTKVQTQINNVRSIQRLSSNTHIKAEEVATHYLTWLPGYTNFLIKVQKHADIITFSLFGLFPLLVLKYIPDPTMRQRAKFHVVGGLLTKTQNTGWLEFRIVAKGKFLLSSINEFIPSLPWYIYKFTQAPLHKYVMTQFGQHLNYFNQNKLSDNEPIYLNKKEEPRDSSKSAHG